MFIIRYLYFQGCDVMHYGPNCSLGCSVNCLQQTCNNITGFCSQGCKEGFYGDVCDKGCSSCSAGCNRDTGECEGACPVRKYGTLCDQTCTSACKQECDRLTGVCGSCADDKYGDFCNKTCGEGCDSGCDRYNGSCLCKTGWEGETCHGNYVTVISPTFHLNYLDVLLKYAICLQLLIYPKFEHTLPLCKQKELFKRLFAAYSIVTFLNVKLRLGLLTVVKPK